MKKEVNIIPSEEDAVVCTWLGFNREIYDWANNNPYAQWLNEGRGNHLRISKETLKQFVTLMQEKGYVFPDYSFEYEDKESEILSKEADVSDNRTNFIPRDYQVQDAERMFRSKKILNASEMGTGKTASAILAALKVDGPKLVICPASLLYNWASEIAKVSSGESIAVYGDKDMSQEAQWLIISFDQLRINSQKIGCGFACVIVDEAHYIKSINNYGKPSSQRATKVIEICRKSEYVYLLTGTPMPSFTKDLFNLLVAIEATQITRDDFRFFAYRYCNGHKKWIGRKSVCDFNGSSNSSELYHLLSNVMIRHRREEVLPDLTSLRQTIPIRIPLKKEMLIDAGNSEIESQLMRARKIISNEKVHSTVNFAKNIIEQERKVVIVCCFLSSIEMLMAQIPKAVKITGEMSPAERQKSISMFQSGNAMACIISLTAGGVGINLTAASDILFNDYDYVPSNMLQAEHRICRIGQSEKCCNAYYFFAENVEVDKVTANIVARKYKNINTVVDNDNIKNEIIETIRREQYDKDRTKKNII